MKKLALCLLLLCCGVKSAIGFPSPEGSTLPQLEAKADLIVIGKIKSFSSQEEENVWIRSPDGVMRPNLDVILKNGGQRDVLLFMSRIKPPGNYTLEITNVLKGVLEQKIISFNSPPLNSFVYKSAQFRAEPGNTIIAFLKKDNIEQISVADDLLYFIPIDEEVAKEELSGSTSEKIRTLMMKSLAKGSFVQPLIYLLRDTRGNEMISIAAKLVKDENAQVRDYALSNLIINQQVAAIPLIAEEGRAYAKDNRTPANAVFDLWKYKVPEAAAPLQPLLFEAPYFFRDLALEPLSSIGNTDGIPYYILTLLDTRHDGSSAVRSAYILQRLTKLPVKFQGSANLANQQETFQQFIAWWQDELSGKHPAAAAAAEKPAIELRQGQRFEATDLPQLNQGLFMKSEFTRQEAIRGLGQFADASSIPYLLIALYDPQPEIAFNAYTILHRLVPDLGAASASKWKNEREAQTKLAFDWWQKHLLDAEKKQLAF